MAKQDDETRPEQGTGLHQRLMDVLVGEIEQQRYPSANMLDLLEEHMTDADRVRITEALLDNLARQRYPSLAMASRIARLAG